MGDALAVMVACGEGWPSVHAELVRRYDPGTIADARRAAFVRDPRARTSGEPATSGGQGAADDGLGDWDASGSDWESILDAWAADLGDAGTPSLSGGGAASRVPGGAAPAAFVPVPAPPARGEDATDPVVRRGRLLAADGRLRVEWPDEDEVTVVVGEHWRRRRGEAVSGTGTVGEAGPPRRPGLIVREQLLVRPWLLLSWLRPRLVASVHVGGRPSTRLAMVPRPGPRPPALEGLADGAQRFDVVVDDETGVIVELAAYYLGRLAERCALRRLTIGDTPDPRLFDLTALG
ncbi:hypothetical protein [Pseudofrankia sp. EUN1h]|uniref:hypothetical protein n=1 Tax=Pseudofrankia sp. EUN1h TaxID=1834515 RepID=UPI0012FEBB4E|nr:hypothetical protein [Pseudofrankia sp. EUN1h]